jgi:hypothetical protein
VAARRGVALLAALAVLGLVGLLVAGGFAAATIAARSSDVARVDALLTASADFALNTVLGAPSALVDLPLGVATPITVPSPDSSVAIVASATRLPAGVLWIVADARTSDVLQGRRRFGLVARFPIPATMPPAPLIARGNVAAGSGATFLSDTSRDAECAESLGAAAVIAPGSVAGLPDGAASQSSPSAADSSTYYMAVAALWSRAPPDAMPGVTHVRGDTTLGGGSFSGVLLVDGALTVAGPLTISGLVIARGPIDASAGSVNLTGAMMSYAPDSAAAPAIRLGAASIRYSPCAVARALRAALPPRPVRQRSWAELF